MTALQYICRIIQLGVKQFESLATYVVQQLIAKLDKHIKTKSRSLLVSTKQLWAKSITQYLC